MQRAKRLRNRFALSSFSSDCVATIKVDALLWNQRR
jgi:hypothetical protein